MFKNSEGEASFIKTKFLYVLYDLLMMAMWNGRNMLQYQYKEYILFLYWMLFYSNFMFVIRLIKTTGWLKLN